MYICPVSSIWFRSERVEWIQDSWHDSQSQCSIHLESELSRWNSDPPNQFQKWQGRNIKIHLDSSYRWRTYFIVSNKPTAQFISSQISILYLLIVYRHRIHLFIYIVQSILFDVVVFGVPLGHYTAPSPRKSEQMETTNQSDKTERHGRRTTNHYKYFSQFFFLIARKAVKCGRKMWICHITNKLIIKIQIHLSVCLCEF